MMVCINVTLRLVVSMATTDQENNQHLCQGKEVGDTVLTQ